MGVRCVHLRSYPISNGMSGYVKVKVMPGAKREKVERVDETTFSIAVKEPAKQNLANERVKVVLARELKVVPGKLRLVAGFRSPNKIFSIS